METNPLTPSPHRIATAAERDRVLRRLLLDVFRLGGVAALPLGAAAFFAAMLPELWDQRAAAVSMVVLTVLCLGMGAPILWVALSTFRGRRDLPNPLDVHRLTGPFRTHARRPRTIGGLTVHHVGRWPDFEQDERVTAEVYLHHSAEPEPTPFVLGVGRLSE